MVNDMCGFCKTRLLARADIPVNEKNPKRNEAQTDRNELDQEMVFHVQSGACPDAIPAPPFFPDNLALRELAFKDFPDYLLLSIPKPVFVPEPLTDPEPDDDEVTSDLTLLDDAMGFPQVWQEGMTPEVRAREKTIHKGTLIAYLGNKEPDRFWIAEVLKCRKKTIEIQWYWRDPDTDRYRPSKTTAPARVAHSWGTWLHWGFQLTRGRIPATHLAAIEKHDRAHRQAKYRRRKEKKPRKRTRREKKQNFVKQMKQMNQSSSRSMSF